ncbi:hypothetical protein M408DRAFT_321004 [Serendipita vermifera MAFF 305830]|uniref:F-box domain-containing protein n=1 Tax=Serendipita vermifera MAFF 305830 TaxID=933852 RepID=A0A0C2WAI6_SERVB|nr:hypothetical protein M408DRAFT_321004 [Serendipita vermifera MAFF 305830]
MITISYLPPEIFIQILQCLGRNSKSLVRVTAVCIQWRVVAINTPYLWTDITIHLKELSESQFLILLNTLDMFLSRTGDLLLDVHWYSRATDKEMAYIEPIYHLFREKAPFHRWKTLSLGLPREFRCKLSNLREVDNFSNLESLVLLRAPPIAYLDLLSSTITPKLVSLEFRHNVKCQPELTTQYAKLFAHAKTFRSARGSILPSIPLPPSLTRLRLWEMPSQPILNVEHLSIKEEIPMETVVAMKYPNLRALGFHPIALLEGRTMSLPKLRWLGFRGNSFPCLKAINAPVLHNLNIYDHESTEPVGEELVLALAGGFTAPKLYGLTMDLPLERKVITRIVKLFPCLKNIALILRDAIEGETTFNDLFFQSSEEGGDYERPCPSLISLYIKLKVVPDDMLRWKRYAKHTARSVGDPFRVLTSEWPGGKYIRVVGHHLGPVEDFSLSYD